MKNNLRNFQARELLINFDSWLDHKLQTESLQIEYCASGIIDVYHNQQLVSQQCQDQFLIAHCPSNRIQVRSNDCKLERFYIDKFDCLSILDFKHGVANLVFDRPFVLWYNDQTFEEKPIKILSDQVLYNDRSEEIVQQILHQLPRLKY